jgi:DNA-directed RNA polymerase subunit E"
MVKQRSCRICRRIYEGDKCPDCGSQEYTEEFKGRVMIFDAENSEVAKKLNIKKKGLYSIKAR